MILFVVNHLWVMFRKPSGQFVKFYNTVCVNNNEVMAYVGIHPVKSIIILPPHYYYGDPIPRPLGPSKTGFSNDRFQARLSEYIVAVNFLIYNLAYFYMFCIFNIHTFNLKIIFILLIAVM